ncbi:MAG: IS110 family transposase [Acidimicrobiia bacterium]
MVVIGIDAHKRTHTAVAVDHNGVELGTKTVAANSVGHLELVRWARRWGEQVRFGAEDCRHVTRRLEADLVRADAQVVRVPPKLMAGTRRSVRARGKSDPIDALAVARAVLREPGLPVARLDQDELEIRLLVDHREDLVAQRTAIINRLRWHLYDLDPTLEDTCKNLTSLRALDTVAQALTTMSGVRAEIASDLVARCQELTAAGTALEKQITTRIKPLAPSLLALHGCGPLTAAKIVAETASVTRFRDRNAYARHNGTAPIPVWSGNTNHHRLNRGGNRQLNAALHRIAITQLRTPGPARDLIERVTASGKTKRDALRILRRRLSDVVYKSLLTDHHAHHAITSLAEAA